MKKLLKQSISNKIPYSIGIIIGSLILYVITKDNFVCFWTLFIINLGLYLPEIGDIFKSKNK